MVLTVPWWKYVEIDFFSPQADENVSDIQQWPEIQILTVEAAQEAGIDTKPDGEVIDRILILQHLLHFN